MADVVFILGAGASQEGGAPLMMEFLDIARILYRANQGARPRFRTVLDAVGELQRVHSKAQYDLVNVESIFAAFEVAKVIKRLGSIAENNIPSLSEDLKYLIAETIEETLHFPVRQDGVMLPPKPYGEFVTMVNRIVSAHKRSVAVITFNYDVACDYAFYRSVTPVDYALQIRESSFETPLLKLHGSLNWATCPTCGDIVAWPIGDYVSGLERDLPNPENVTLRISRYLNRFVHCRQGQPLTGEVVIVPPTWNKSDYHMAITSVWQRAAKELSGAENVFVIGYSLPDTDAFFRSLYALGSIGPLPLERFHVFNPDRSGRTEERFRQLLGPGAAQRFRYFPLTFSQALNELAYVFPNVER